MFFNFKSKTTAKCCGFLFQVVMKERIALDKLQELTCNKPNQYIPLQGGAIVYNGFIFRNMRALVSYFFKQNKKLQDIENIKEIKLWTI